jgi:predicted metal-binding membrane protein
MMNTRRPDRAFMVVAALAFAVSAAVTVIWCGSMSAMPGMEMPGGWTMSMAWMRMPGQSAFGAAATFFGMWTVMMMAMMLPVLVPTIARYRAVNRGHARLDRQTSLVAAGYFAVWTLVGLAAYPLGIALADAAMRFPALSRMIPLATGMVVLLAGLLQFTRWKARTLASCRALPGRCSETPWRDGLRMGFRCARCCLGPTAVLLAVGVMELRAMAVVTLAVAAERLVPKGGRIARVTGGLLVGVGFWMIAAPAPTWLPAPEQDWNWEWASAAALPEPKNPKIPVNRGPRSSVDQ